MTGKQLKNSILQWAIQGKLVPQDPNDEPASVLLEKIRAEKAQLIKEGKIKKDKNESIIYRGDDNSYYEKFADGKVVCIDDEIPFEIPATWEWCRLKEISSLISKGSSPSWQGIKYVEKGIPFITSENIRNGYIDFSAPKFLEEGFNDLQSRSILRKGDLLTNIVGASIGRSAIFDLDYDNCNINQAVAVIRLLELSIGIYILLVLNSPFFITQMLGKVVETARPNISLGSIENLFVPIPPLVEQKRIVKRSQEISPIIEKYSIFQSQHESLNNNIKTLLKKSILQEAIQGRLVPQDPNDKPASALLQRIKEEKQKLVKEGKLKKKDVIDSVIFKGDDNKYYEQIGGTAVPIESDYDFPNTWEVVRLSHICRLIDGEKKEGQYVCLDAKYLRGKSTGDHLNSGKFVIKGDNIILVDGENSGEVFAVPHDGYMGSTFKQLWVSEAMHLPYVLFFIQFYKDLLRNSKKGAAIPHLNKEIFYSLLIGIPPYQEQVKISNCIKELYAQL